jgi:hypothetical protein
VKTNWKIRILKRKHIIVRYKIIVLSPIFPMIFFWKKYPTGIIKNKERLINKDIRGNKVFSTSFLVRSSCPSSSIVTKYKGVTTNKVSVVI